MSTLDKICNLLEQQGKKQKDLTDFLGISKNSFTDWKSGRIKSYTKHLSKIAEFLGVSTDYLLGVEQKLDFSPTEAEVLRFRSNSKFPFETPDETFVATNREKKMIMEYRTKPEKQNAVNNILNIENPTALNDEALMFALYGNDNQDITPEMLDDVRDFAQYIREKKNKNK